MDVKYERVLASAIANPNAVTIQLLDNERTDILRHESNSLNGYAYEREIRDAVD